MFVLLASQTCVLLGTCRQKTPTGRQRNASSLVSYVSNRRLVLGSCSVRKCTSVCLVTDARESARIGGLPCTLLTCGKSPSSLVSDLHFSARGVATGTRRCPVSWVAPALLECCTLHVPEARGFEIQVRGSRVRAWPSCSIEVRFSFLLSVCSRRKG